MSEKRMAGSEEFRNNLEKRKGTEWYDSASKVGELHDPRIDDNKGKQMYSGAEIRAEMRHGRGDMTTEELTKKYEQDYASGKINLNGNAKDFLTDIHGASLVRANKGGGGDKDPIATIQPVPTRDAKPERGSGGDQIIQPGNPGEVGGGGRPGTGIDNSTNVSVNQDNDIITDIVGNDNNVTNNQDNSVNTIGGRVGSFNGSRGSMFKDNWMQNFFS
jgi:hypothetical protein